jgi:hypothetical protein
VDVTLGAYRCPFEPWRPGDGRLFGPRFSFDAETTAIDDEHPDLTPAYVLGAACDGRRGAFVSREHAPAFFVAHRGAEVVFHNAAFDLAVLHHLLGPAADVYGWVDGDRVWDTRVLKRLLSLATAGHTARCGSGLADCALEHLGVALEKGEKDAEGKQVRTNFGQFLGKQPGTIPFKYLTYLAHDAMATWYLFDVMNQLVRGVLRGADSVYGHAGEDWLRDVIRRFGPLTHHVQLRASILAGALTATGIGIDQDRSQGKAEGLRRTLEALRERLRRRGYLPGEPGCAKALQALLTRFARSHPDLELKATDTGRWSLKEEDLGELAACDPFFADLTLFKAAEKLLATYVAKMGRPRLHPRFGYLLETGRTYCGGGFNLQNLPREKDVQTPADTVRGCFVPGEDKVFIDADFSQIELVVLGYALDKQFGLGGTLAAVINGGQDVHRLVAAEMLGKPPHEISKEGRNSVKPVSFGRPGGMGVNGLRKVAKAGYGIDLTDEQVQERIDAYHRLCPELTPFLEDEWDGGLVVAEALGLTPADYSHARGRHRADNDPEGHLPTGWVGGMLLKALKEERPRTRQGRDYDAEELDYFWARARRLPVKLDAALRRDLEGRRPGRKLWQAVRTWAGRRPVFTLTGRLRAAATFCSARNNVFQGPAADGAILGMWRVWRAGYQVVDFVHDQLVVESPADDRVQERIDEIEALMKAGMAEVVPGMLVKVETVVTRSLNKKELDERYTAKAESLQVPPSGRSVA